MAKLPLQNITGIVNKALGDIGKEFRNGEWVAIVTQPFGDTHYLALYHYGTKVLEIAFPALGTKYSTYAQVTSASDRDGINSVFQILSMSDEAFYGPNIGGGIR